jgi:NodT family efflux transporter outer membrane factor (OMF) lipoprotein
MTLPRPLSFVTVSALALSACQTVGPDYVPPDLTAPARFDAATSLVSLDEIDSRWWRTFGDPMLNTLVERALAANLDVVEAEARIDEARALRRQAQGGEGPQLAAEAAGSTQRLSENGAQLANLPPGVRPRLEFEQYQAGFDARWELDLFGRTRREVAAASARVEAAEEARNAVRLSVAAEVARTYAEHRAAQTRIAVAERTAASSARTVELVRLRRGAGEASNVDLRRALADHREDGTVVPRLQAQSAAALYAIDRLVGAEPGSTRRTLAQAPSAELNPPAVIPAGLPSELARRRPDIRQAERELAAATADIGVATADLYPRFSLTGTLGLDSIRPGDFLQAASRFWRIGPSISAPLLDQGRRRAEVDRRRAARETALAAYKGAVVEALSEVETALVRYERERARTAALIAARAELQDAAALIRLRYRSGEAPLTEVLDAERQTARLDDAVAESKAQAIVDWIALHKSLGGGWAACA